MLISDWSSDVCSSDLRSLVNQQMISIGSDAADGRVRRARITGKGNNVFQDAQPFWHHAQAFVATTLGKENLRALHDWLDRVTPAFRNGPQDTRPDSTIL